MAAEEPNKPTEAVNDKPACNEEKCNALIKIHQTMLVALRTREADILKFVGFLVAGLGVFFYVLKDYIAANPPVHCGKSADPMMLLIGSGFSVLILTIGNVYASALGYNFRSILLFICKMEYHLGVADYKPAKWPKYIGKLKVKFFPPELIGVYWWSFLVLATAICISVGFLLDWGPCKFIGGCIIPILSSVIGALFYKCKQQELVDKENEEKKLNKMEEPIDSDKKWKCWYWWLLLVLVPVIGVGIWYCLQKG